MIFAILFSYNFIFVLDFLFLSSSADLICLTLSPFIMQNDIFPFISYTALEIEFTRSQVVAAIPGTFFCAWYALKKHWLANNILGLAFCIQVQSQSF